MNKPANKKNLTPLLRRVLGIMLREYKAQFGLVVLLILGATLATLRGTLFMRDLVDLYIKPMIGVETPDFGPLAHALFSLALVYLAGLLCSYGYNRIMAVISQGTLKSIRIQLFTRMESLSIQYFDTTPHGDIMSVYTNDVDTLRQLIGQSIPQLVNSTVTIVITLISMVCLNIPLTVLTLCMVAVMLAAASKLGGAAGTYFIKQQRSLGKVYAYIEEMMEGQKVVKVFCHERENIDAFRKINQELRESAKSANQIANILMPVNANLGNISYLCTNGSPPYLYLTDLPQVGNGLIFQIPNHTAHGYHSSASSAFLRRDYLVIKIQEFNLYSQSLILKIAWFRELGE